MTTPELEEIKKIFKEEIKLALGTDNGRVKLAQDLWNWIHKQSDGHIRIRDLLDILETEQRGIKHQSL